MGTSRLFQTARAVEGRRKSRTRSVRAYQTGRLRMAAGRPVSGWRPSMRLPRRLSWAVGGQTHPGAAWRRSCRAAQARQGAARRRTRSSSWARPSTSRAGRRCRSGLDRRAGRSGGSIRDCWDTPWWWSWWEGGLTMAVAMVLMVLMEETSGRRGSSQWRVGCGWVVVGLADSGMPCLLKGRQPVYRRFQRAAWPRANGARGWAMAMVEWPREQKAHPELAACRLSTSGQNSRGPCTQEPLE